jgi:murein L,D-transpeptidase YafK
MPISKDQRARVRIGMAARALGIAGVGLLAVGMWVAPLIEARGNSSERSAADNGTPGAFDATELQRRLAAKGVALGTPIMVRIFKQEAELEVWIDKGARFERFASYAICNWSGVLGPKLTEGDRQSPEGLYSIGADQLHRKGRWRRSLDIGYPNTFDRAHGRTGSFILVHGGCSTIGCFAMTNPVMDEIFALSEAALANGQERIQVHVFPFRMTRANLNAHANSPWSGFLSNMKDAYDVFERTSIPPDVSVCGDRYVAGQDTDPGLCVVNVSEASVATVRPGHTRYARLARRGRVVSRRYARRAYAAARRVRMAAYARRQATYLGGVRRAQR